ncbi:sulfotransferase [Pleurocapsales cyanobacterium LEGE 10410]|nr:sulfotransferase [Pleurocapsales cyanobacterium LEGE 10410]
MAKPNFFIVGAPKCGTTALSEYLKEHPNIYLSDPKEPHYFALDFEQYRLTKTWETYLDLFKDSSAKHTAIGEGSVFYLFSSVALKQIYQFAPQAKIIVMLRNPVDLVYSFHSQVIFTADENVKDFKRAWRLQGKRQQGIKIPRQCREAALLQYAALGRLGEQMERLFRIFPRQQVEIIWFEDFVQSTKQVYERVLDFLAVAPDNRQDFIRINENKSHKLGLVGNFSEKPPALLNDLALKARDLLGLERLYVLDTIRSINTKVASRQPLSDRLRAELTAEFESDIKKLSRLLDKDLSHWLLAKPTYI